MLERFFKKAQARQDAIAQARERFTSWKEIAGSKGWQVYTQKIEQKIEQIKHKIEVDTSLTGEDLKRLQLALQVYREIQRVPKDLEDNARGGEK